MALLFPDTPQFMPHYTPIQMVRQGIFGGNYFNPLLDDIIPGSWQDYVPGEFLDEFQDTSGKDNWSSIRSASYVKSTNLHGVLSGSSYSDWLNAGWLRNQDPYGWFNWYINFYYGRRSIDDARQIRRWQAFGIRHGGMLKRYPNSKKTRQNLLHFAIDYSLIIKSTQS